MFSYPIHNALGQSFLTVLLMSNSVAVVAAGEMVALQGPQPLLVTEAVVEHETPIKELSKENLPGERLVDGRVTAIRSDLSGHW